MSLSNLLGISKQSMLAHQKAIDTTAKNIANVNSEGYHRRQIDMSRLTSTSSFLGFSSLNSVYSENEISIIRNGFVENQLRGEYQNLSKYSSDEMLLTQVQDIFGEPQDSGLANVMSEFWNSWSELANNPDSQSARVVVRDKGVSLANTFHRIYDDLRNLNNEISTDIQSKVAKVNMTLEQLQTINEQGTGSLSSDIIDQRDQLINELSEMINIDMRNDSNGELIISSGGQILLSEGYINEYKIETNNVDGFINVDVKVGEGDRSANITSGELGSLLNVANQQIPGHIDKINQLAQELANQVNNVHANGYNLSGITGINFFSENVSGANDFYVNDEVVQVPSLIASALESGTPGDGTIAQNIADLQNNNVIQNGTFADYYGLIISDIGSQLQEATFLSDSQVKVVESLENQRDSVSGVSLDEELTKLLEFEKGYEASARLISTVNSLMDTVINMV